MSEYINLNDHDVVFISYDEPNADYNYKHLLSFIPNAKRVHKIKGFDNAHKEAAKISETERFITIDGDNWVHEYFWEEKFNNFAIYKPFFKNYIFSWSSINNINDLIYGNGGLKSWPRDLCLNMKTHENAIDKKSTVDFCWNTIYLQFNDVSSTSIINNTPLQSFRAGFREGCKMSLMNGLKVNHNGNIKSCLHIKNYHRLCIWTNIGMDIENGIWAIYGSRLGCYMTNLTDWDFSVINDHNYIYELYKQIENNNILQKIKSLGNILINELKLEITEEPFNKENSIYWKSHYKSEKRVEKELDPWEGVKIQLTEWHNIKNIPNWL